jgi:hypothetical protein
MLLHDYLKLPDRFHGFIALSLIAGIVASLERVKKWFKTKSKK